MMYFPSLVAERIHQPTSRNLATMLDTCINTLKITECHVTDRFRWGDGKLLGNIYPELASRLVGRGLVG